MVLVTAKTVRVLVVSDELLGSQVFLASFALEAIAVVSVPLVSHALGLYDLQSVMGGVRRGDFKYVRLKENPA